MKRILVFVTTIVIFCSTFTILGLQVRAGTNEGDPGTVYDYNIVSVTKTGLNEITVKLEVRYCPACNPNDISNPGCYEFTHGYPPPYYPYQHWCGGIIDGRYIAVRIKDSSGTVLGTTKLVCNPVNWPLNTIINRDFVFTNVPLVVEGTITAEADIYCSWCGHWYPQPVSLVMAPLKVCIDPGHDPASKPVEYAINKGVADKLRSRLEAENIEVYFTDPNDDVSARIAYVNSIDPDIFLSLHCNALEGFKRTFNVYATREGLVGETTANGHVIEPRDHFVALPSRKVLCSKDGHEYEVKITYNGRSVVAPVWDVGPWNTQDDYWNPPSEHETWKDLPQGMPEAQAAFQYGYNDGKDQFGRTVTNPAGIDLADGTFWDDLGMIDNDWVAVEFLFLRIENGIPIGTARGSEVWIYDDTDSEEQALNEHDLAIRSLNELTKEIGSRARAPVPKEKQSPWTEGIPILRGVTTCPSVLLEMEFYDYADAVTYRGIVYRNMRELMTTDTWQDAAADGIVNGIMGYFKERGLTISSLSPVELYVIDPDGLRICKQFNEIPGATYVEIDLDEDGDLDDQIRIPERKIGDYFITVIPKPGMLPTDTFTLEVSFVGIPVIIAEHMPISEIPAEPYRIISTETEIIPPSIPATIDLDPDTLNLKSKGKWITCYIELSEGYAIDEVDISSIELYSTIAAAMEPAEVGDHDSDGIADLIVKFDRAEVVTLFASEVVPGDYVVEVRGMVSGTLFRGTDTITVISPP